MPLKRKKIAYITGTRADFGLMTPVLDAIQNNQELSLSLYATGTHLLPKFGNTFSEVKKYNAKVKKINATIENDNKKSQIEFFQKYIYLLSKELTINRPDFILTLGDRIEMLGTAITAAYLGIPSGQLHGGEITTTIDDPSRHAITRFSNLHFPATKQAAERIRKMGEEPWRIHVVGAPALDVIKNFKIPNRSELNKKVRLRANEPFFLITLHPVDDQKIDKQKQISILIESVKKFNTQTVVIYPNSDPGGRAMIQEINKERKNTNFFIFPNLPYQYFLSLEKYTQIWIGNSSAGIIESPSFKTPVINIGNRQRGREQTQNIVNTGYNSAQITSAIRTILKDKSFNKKLKEIKNPWGEGTAGKKIASILARTTFNHALLNKHLTYE